MKKYSRHEPAYPLYTERDAIKSLEHLAPRPMDQWIELEKGLSFRFIRSGHILGSSFVQFNYATPTGSRVLTFSGDIGNGRSLILKEPTQITETDELVLESTYGDRAQEHSQQFDLFRDVINKVLNRGGTLVIPAFSVGRTQEILYMLHILEEKNEIKKYNVYLDSPMALDATDIYMKHSDELKPEIRLNQSYSPLKSARFTPVRDSDDSMLLCMNDEPKIVITAAGMLTGGRVMHHLKMRLPNSKNGVLFVGYQLPGTKGYLLKNGLNTIRIHHQEVDVEAEIFSIESLSAHADTNDLVAWVKGFTKKPSKIFLNHGEPGALEALKYRLHRELKLNTLVAAQGPEYVLGD
jgi:metallo-beta-lactamase family protein